MFDAFEIVKQQADTQYAALLDVANNIYARGGCGSLSEIKEYMKREGEVYAGAIEDVDTLKDILKRDDMPLSKYYVSQEGGKTYCFSTAENALAYCRRIKKLYQEPVTVHRFGFLCGFGNPHDVMAALREFWLPGEELQFTLERVNHTQTVRAVCEETNLSAGTWKELHDGLAEMINIYGADAILEENHFADFFSNFW